MDSMAIKQSTTCSGTSPNGLPGIDVILFGMDEDLDLFVRSAYLGVSGYVLQEASASEIIAAVLGVARGEAAWPPRLCMALGRHLSREGRTRARFPMLPGGVKYCLTQRQLELIAWLRRTDQQGNRRQPEPL